MRQAAIVACMGALGAWNLLPAQVVLTKDSGLRWEFPLDGRVLRWSSGDSTWSEVPLPTFRSSKTAGHEAFTWDGTDLWRARCAVEGHPESPVEVRRGRLLHDPDGRTRWIWSDWKAFPPHTRILAATQDKLLLERARRDGRARTRELAQCDWETGSSRMLRAFHPEPGQAFEIRALVRDGQGIVFISTGQVLHWEPEDGGSLREGKGRLTDLAPDTRPWSPADAFTPFPAFFCEPFPDEDGTILIGYTILEAPAPAHLRGHLESGSGPSLGVPDTHGSLAGLDLKALHPRSCFMGWKPAEGLPTRVDPARYTHLFLPEPGAGPCLLLPGSEGKTFWVDPRGHLTSRNPETGK